MASGKVYISFLCWTVFLGIIGILLFTKGFLLKRLVVNENSTCQTNFTNHDNPDGCWRRSHFNKTVIVVIDALRYDFVTYNDSLSESGNELPFQNKMPYLNELLLTKPLNSRLLKFVADPPTTTMQRLKGLTTGSLPTFVDVSANFHSSEIMEDNWIDQLLKKKKRVVFMGDDTWLSLFPNRFHREYPFPSFNVQDLDTVDDGVTKHLVPEIKAGDWDVLIAHFLGVDHCGHRYGPNHAEMTRKLLQMDEILRKVIATLDNDTVLFVLGDHGMTRTGDHGGDSDDELDAALFIHSPVQISGKKVQQKTVSQIDLVPTISLLLGTPVPFSSLGTIILDVFSYCPWWQKKRGQISQMYEVVKTLRLNSNQVRRYIMDYAQISDEFPDLEFAEADLMFHHSESSLQEMETLIQIEGKDKEVLKKLKTLRDDYVKYLSLVKEMCKGIWAKFDASSMLLGFMTVLTAFFMVIFVLTMSHGGHNPVRYMFTGFIGSCWAASFYAYLYYVGLNVTGLIASLSLGFPAVIISTHITSKITMPIVDRFVIKETKETEITPRKARRLELVKFPTRIAVGVSFAYMSGMFSNSYVVYEDHVSAYLFHALGFIIGFQIAKDLYNDEQIEAFAAQSTKQKTKISNKFDLGRLLTSPVSLLVMALIIMNATMRLGFIFKACREEQFACDISNFLQPLSSLPEEWRSYKNIRYFFSVSALGVVPVIIRQFMKHYGNLNGYELTVVCAHYVPLCGAIFTALYWAMYAATTEALKSLPTWQITLLPQSVYVLSLVTFCIVATKPLCIYVVQNTRTGPMVHAGESNVIPKVYKHVKENWKKHITSPTAYQASKVSRSDDEEKPPLVYGLGTVYSAAVIVVVAVSYILLTLLLGDGLGPSLTVQIVTMYIFLELHTAYMQTSSQEDIGVPWSSVVMWGLLSSNFFFATGHQATVPNIRWDAAFVGFQGDHDYYVFPALLITLNTFASHILCTLSLPLLLFWPHFRTNFTKLFDKNTLKKSTQGEFALHEDRDKLRSSLFKLILSHLLFHLCKLFGSLSAAGLHKRHLMVWKIFAPRFVFEGATFIVTGLTSLLIFLFIMRVDSALAHWVDRITLSAKAKQ